MVNKALAGALSFGTVDAIMAEVALPSRSLTYNKLLSCFSINLEPILLP